MRYQWVLNDSVTASAVSQFLIFLYFSRLFFLPKGFSVLVKDAVSIYIVLSNGLGVVNSFFGSAMTVSVLVLIWSLGPKYFLRFDVIADGIACFVFSLQYVFHFVCLFTTTCEMFYAFYLFMDTSFVFKKEI